MKNEIQIDSENPYQVVVLLIEIEFEIEIPNRIEMLLIATRPSALGMSDPIWGPLIHIFVDEKKKCEG